MEIFKGGTTDAYSIAKYGDTARIGKDGSSRFLINPASLQAYDDSNSKYFEVTPTTLTFTGTMSADKIKSGTISDTANKNSWNLSTGQLVTKRGNIADFTIADNSLSSTSTSGNIQTNFSIDGTRLLAERIGTNNSLYNAFKIQGDYITSRFRSVDGSSVHGVSLSGISGLNFCRESNYSGDIWSPSLAIVGSINGSSDGMAITPTQKATVYGNLSVIGNLSVTGTKPREVETDNYQNRLLYCYETPTPLFGDIGEAVIGEDGFCYVDVDDIFSETIAENVEYQVFLQKEGDGDCWVADKTQRFFVIQGTPNLKVAWELKGKQRGYGNIRLERPNSDLDEYVNVTDIFLEDYVAQQEDLLYGNY